VPIGVEQGFQGNGRIVESGRSSNRVHRAAGQGIWN